MNYENVILEIKKLNPNCDIKISEDNIIYISANPQTLILPYGVSLSFNDGKYNLSGVSISSIRLQPINTFLANEKDYFPELIFNNASYENIYELTSDDTINLIKKYLTKISDIEVTSGLAMAIGSSSDSFLKSLCYNGLKSESKFLNSKVNIEARNQLYQYVNSVAQPQVYKDPTQIQTGWESFQSWHIKGGSKPDDKTFTHRFYLSISPNKVYEVAKILMEKYNQYGRPYYFKVAQGRKTKDSIVIYASHGTLNTTLQIFRDLEPFMNNISNDIASPHPLTYPLTPWLGYASEIMDGRTSYTDLMCDVISKPLTEALNKYAREHQNDIIDGISGKEFFSDTDVNTKIERAQLVIKKIMNNPNSLNNLINNILREMQSKGINLQNIYYTDEVVNDLLNFRDFKKEQEYKRGFISLKILIIPLVILLGISIALLLT